MTPLDLQLLDAVIGGGCDLSGLSGAAREIIGAESGGEPTAKNGVSTAFGLGQLTVANRLSILGDDYDSTDCGQQLGAYGAYVQRRYRTDARALAFRRRKGWY